MAKKQPGTMLYFDVRPSLKRLTNEEKGILFEAILDYGEHGVLPELDGALGVAWDFIQPRLDRDRERYDNQVLQRKYAVYCREIKRTDGEPLDFDSWLMAADNGIDQPLSADNRRYPTTISTPTPTSTSTSTSTGGGVLTEVFQEKESTGATGRHSPEAEFEEKRQAAMQRVLAYKT